MTTKPEFNVENMIGLALERKNISNEYHAKQYPYFMRSQGPFRVFDHAHSRGPNYVANIQKSND